MRTIGTAFRLLFVATAFPLLASCGNSDGPLDNKQNTPGAGAITIKDGNLQVANLGTSVARKPSVIVTAENGVGVPGVPVVFSVTNGGGVITDSSAVTDANGVAVIGSWTLGQNEGANTVSATVAGLAPVFFIATAFDPCTHKREFPMQGQLIGFVSYISGCSFAATDAVDSFSLSLPQQQSFRMTIAPPIELMTVNFTQIPADTDMAEPIFTVGRGVGGTYHVILPAGTYRGSIISSTGIATRFETRTDYAITVEKTPEDAGKCDAVNIQKGVVTAQSITDNDCADASGEEKRYDSYNIRIRQGTAYTFSVQSTSAKELEVYGPDGHLAAKNTGNTNPTSSTITAIPNTDGVYELRVVAADAAHRGDYTLQSVESAYVPIR